MAIKVNLDVRLAKNRLLIFLAPFILYFMIRIVMIVFSIVIEDYLFFYKKTLYQSLAWIDISAGLLSLFILLRIFQGRRLRQWFLFVSFFPFLGLVFLVVLFQNLEFEGVRIVDNNNNYALNIRTIYVSDVNVEDSRLRKVSLYEKKFSFIYKKIYSFKKTMTNIDFNKYKSKKIDLVYLENEKLLKIGDSYILLN